MSLKNTIARQFIVSPAPWLRKLYPSAIWSKSPLNKTLYLTFDDGPTPAITEYVLDLLAQYNAKATFFCIGKNILEHPTILKKIASAGHTIGNHTQHHLNGWKTNNDIYLNEVNTCNQTITDVLGQSPILFRPPYGKVTHSQYRLLSNSYQLVFWDVLSMDYDITIAHQKIVENVFDYAQNGSVIVFHDSLKASATLQYVLPKVLTHFNQQGYNFAAL
jgi:peptidoglycan/xylan/chitin deacetylase (PgdA/CDA1 family)